MAKALLASPPFRAPHSTMSLLTGNVAHILDAGSDQEAQSMDDKETGKLGKIMKMMTEAKKKLT